jgi:hypothetical protein
MKCRAGWIDTEFESIAVLAAPLNAAIDNAERGGEGPRFPITLFSFLPLTRASHGAKNR